MSLAFQGGDWFAESGTDPVVRERIGSQFSKRRSHRGRRYCSGTRGIIASTTPLFGSEPDVCCHGEHLADRGFVDAAYLVLGTLGGNTGPDTTSKKYFGFELRNNSGSSEVYIVNGSGSAQTRTLVTGLGINIKNESTYEARLFSGSRIEFYINGTKVGTHTTNLPSGAPSSRQFFQAYYDGITGTTGNPTFRVSNFTAILSR